MIFHHYHSKIQILSAKGNLTPTRNRHRIPFTSNLWLSECHKNIKMKFMTKRSYYDTCTSFWIGCILLLHFRN